MHFTAWGQPGPTKEDRAGKNPSLRIGESPLSLSSFWEILGVIRFQAGPCPQRDLSITAALLHIHIN